MNLKNINFIIAITIVIYALSIKNFIPSVVATIVTVVDIIICIILAFFNWTNKGDKE